MYPVWPPLSPPPLRACAHSSVLPVNLHNCSVFGNPRTRGRLAPSPGVWPPTRVWVSEKINSSPQCVYLFLHIPSLSRLCTTDFLSSWWSCFQRSISQVNAAATFFILWGCWPCPTVFLWNLRFDALQQKHLSMDTLLTCMNIFLDTRWKQEWAVQISNFQHRVIN